MLPVGYPTACALHTHVDVLGVTVIDGVNDGVTDIDGEIDGVGVELKPTVCDGDGVTDTL